MGVHLYNKEPPMAVEHQVGTQETEALAVPGEVRVAGPSCCAMQCEQYGAQDLIHFLKERGAHCVRSG